MSDKSIDRWGMGRAARYLSASPSAAWRWAKHGVKIGEHRVKLAYHRIGRRMFTTQRDCDEFVRKMTLVDRGEVAGTIADNHDDELDAKLAAEGL